MKIPLYKINTFTRTYQGGNPAGVCPLASWLSVEVMQAVATENGFSETAFFVKNGDQFDLRWFTPSCEIDLCGHATLASAFVLREELGDVRDYYDFNTRSGVIRVVNRQPLLILNMPTFELEQQAPLKILNDALGVIPQAAYKSRFYLAVLNSSERVAQLKPNMKLLKQLDASVIVTAVGSGEVDFVSRFFGPLVGIDEDPVTGSAHCVLVPYWVQRLNKRLLKAKQLSSRGGELICELKQDRVHIGGEAVLYFKGEIVVTL